MQSSEAPLLGESKAIGTGGATAWHTVFVHLFTYYIETAWKIQFPSSGHDN